MPKSKRERIPNPFEKKLPQNSELKANKNFKDGLFRFIFGKNKEYALSLYNALNKTNYTDASELEFTTLKNAFMISIKEDVALIFMSTKAHIAPICLFEDCFTLQTYTEKEYLIKAFLNLRQYASHCLNTLFFIMVKEKKKL